ncbi:MAG: type III-B CRISPR-associated protein Cas10/Cmr2 [Verrucomicrobia bacterium]|nr:type III-B CRISPR-associated protein Cas10/Cmr2 [Verrucomicrobiota bacterium]
MPAPSSLLKFQIGPVQDFIAQARSTRDLWSGSYLLSWLVAAGIRKLVADGGTLIFPVSGDRQPLLRLESAKQEADHSGLLTPNLPNIFVAEVLADQAAGIARSVKSVMEEEWKSISGACYKALVGQRILEAAHETAFKDQVETFLSISWQISTISGDYAAASDLNGKHLDAVRQTRDFQARVIDLAVSATEKDSLSTKDVALVSGSDTLRNSIKDPDYRNLFKHNDHLSAITLVKRVWHLAYLVPQGLHADSTRFKIRSTRAIAARTDKLDDEENTDTAKGEKYLAAIAFDGDSIGEWVNGDKLSDRSDLRQHHTAFSAALSAFALGKVRAIVDQHEGFLIYAGGDDVVALVPADVALGCAAFLRDAFVDASKAIKDKNGKSPDASAGIAIAHFKSPLQDLIRAAQAAEKRAKNEVGRPAFSISLMKRSGEISHWGAQWRTDAIIFHDKIFSAMKNGSLSARFPHRVCQLLEPYLTVRTGIAEQADVAGFLAHEIIEKEVLHAATRQGSMAIADSLKEPLRAFLENLRDHRTKQESAGKTFKQSVHQLQLTAVIGLCTTLAFTFRNLPETPMAERQTL